MEHPAVVFLRLLRRASVGARVSFGVDLQSCAPLTVQMSHRKFLHETLFDYAFKHGGQTTLFTIKSVHTHETVKQWLPEIMSSGTRITVLTLDPSGAVGVFDAIAQHLGMEREEVANDVRDAWENWKQLAVLAPDNLEVLCFSSLPVWQGYIVHGDYAVVELLPCRSSPQERPAIVALSGINTDVFEMLTESVRRIPKFATPVSRQRAEAADDGVLRHAVYTQFFTEYRRYRDYELQTCTWFSALMGFFVVLFGKSELLALLHQQVWALLIFAFLMLLFGCGACLMLRYGKRRLSETRELLEENFPDSFKSFGNRPRLRMKVVPYAVLFGGIVVVTMAATFGICYLAVSYNPPPGG